VDRHCCANRELKALFQQHLQQLQDGDAVLVMDFKENVSLGKGPRELGNSWYTKERRTVFGVVVHVRQAGEVVKYHFNIISDCLTHDAIFVKYALSSLFASNAWKQLGIRRNLAIWSDNAAHFKNKVLLSYYAQLCHENEDFERVLVCFFEAYHGKSLVDGMFGVMTNWIDDWIVQNYLNSTDDLLRCFNYFNQFHPNRDRNLFASYSFDQSLWTKLRQTAVKGIKMKQAHYFVMNRMRPHDRNMIELVTLEWRVNANHELVSKRPHRDIIYWEETILKAKNPPKYSIQTEVVNSPCLTTSDVKLLKNFAAKWNLQWKD
jgi:hypothetical protein